MNLVIGWDISTSAIGICVRRYEDDCPSSYYVVLPKGETMMEKYTSAVTQIRDLFRYPPSEGCVHVVEDRLGGFTRGMTTQQTLMKLAQMNAVVSFELQSWGWGPVVHIPPVTVKKMSGLKVPKGGDKKAMTIALVRARDPSFPYRETKNGNPVKGVDDMADAWLLSEAWVKMSSKEAAVGQGQEAQGDRVEAREVRPRKERGARVPVPRPPGPEALPERP